MESTNMPEFPPLKRPIFAANLLSDEFNFPKKVYPKVSIIIPTFNCSQLITTTLESILSQEYPDFEVILIDANSSDRTLQVAKSFLDNRVKIYTVASFNRYEMLNKGISLAQGIYINFMFPGDFYIQSKTMAYIITLALEHDSPHLVYGASLLRDGRSEVKMLFRNLNSSILKKGQQPTTLQSCWFRADVFKNIGKFSTAFLMRGELDLLCRLWKQEDLKFFQTTRVLTDYDLRRVTRKMVIEHFWDTLRIVHTHFGGIASLRWIFIQKDVRRFLNLWWRSVKFAFSGSHNP